MIRCTEIAAQRLACLHLDHKLPEHHAHFIRIQNIANLLDFWAGSLGYLLCLPGTAHSLDAL